MATQTIPKTMTGVPPEGYGKPGWGPVTMPVPELAPDRFLVEVRAASINPADLHSLRGGLVVGAFGRLSNGLKKPTPDPATGSDVAGVVVAVGTEASGFKVGDEVFGGARGSLAQYGSAKVMALKPASLSWEQAASIPIAGLTALQGLRDKAEVQPGQKVLINGASGGVGTFTVQIAKALGAHVTGVCSTRNLDLVRSLGADEVIDYTKEDFATRPERYDVVFDVVGNRSMGALRGVATPDGTVILCGGGHQNGHGQNLAGPLLKILSAKLFGRFHKQRVVFYIAKFKNEDLATLAHMVEEGKLTPSVDRAYTLDQASQAFSYLAAGHAPGKIVITGMN